MLGYQLACNLNNKEEQGGLVYDDFKTIEFDSMYNLP